jgi:hypothetical protein
MPWLSPAPILIWAVIFVPLGAFFWLLYPSNKLTLLVLWLAYTLGNLFFFMSVNWALVNYYLRFVALALSLALLLHWLKPLRNVPWLPKRNLYSLAGLMIAFLLNVFPIYLLAQIIPALDISSDTTSTMQLLYPVRTGLYVIANGGDGVDGGILNSYVSDWLGRPTEREDEQAFAVDIMELRTNGTIADRIMDKDYLNYEIFNETVYSPCIGQIVSVIDGNPLVTPLSPAGGSGDRMGNRITLRCPSFGTDYFVTLSNLRSAIVEVGEQVDFNRMVGTVGNSASDSVPSLHVYVTLEDGTPVPILFEAGYYFKFVSRNYVYVRHGR